eukprot:SAG31_NODE_2797_length_5081_cov_11.092935_11_plen_98_part_00
MYLSRSTVIHVNLARTDDILNYSCTKFNLNLVNPRVPFNPTKFKFTSVSEEDKETLLVVLHTRPDYLLINLKIKVQKGTQEVGGHCVQCFTLSVKGL